MAATYCMWLAISMINWLLALRLSHSRAQQPWSLRVTLVGERENGAWKRNFTPFPWCLWALLRSKQFLQPAIYYIVYRIYILLDLQEENKAHDFMSQGTWLRTLFGNCNWKTLDWSRAGRIKQDLLMKAEWWSDDSLVSLSPTSSLSCRSPALSLVPDSHRSIE